MNKTEQESILCNSSGLVKSPLQIRNCHLGTIFSNCLFIYNRKKDLFFLAYSMRKFSALVIHLQVSKRAHCNFCLFLVNLNLLCAPPRTAWPDAQCTATIRGRIFLTPVLKSQLFAHWWAAAWAVVWTTTLTWSPAWPVDSKRIWTLYSSEEQWWTAVDRFTHTAVQS